MKDLNEHAINPKKKPPVYSAKELIEIAKIIAESGYCTNMLTSICTTDIPKDSKGWISPSLEAFEDSLKYMFHDSIKKVLFSPYDDLPLLINIERSDLCHGLYVWRLNNGK